MPKVTYRKLSPIEWEAERDEFDCGSNDTAAFAAQDSGVSPDSAPLRFDFHIRLEQDNYVIDVFDSCHPDADEAYLTSFTCETWKQVERYCREYDGVKVI